MAAGVLYVDDQDRVLIVEPTYRDHWNLPGGVVEANESPYAAARREIGEELGLDRAPGRLLVVDWMPPKPDRSDGVMVLFDGGCLTADDISALRLPPEELRGYAFCTIAEAANRLSPRLGRHLAAAVEAPITPGPWHTSKTADRCRNSQPEPDRRHLPSRCRGWRRAPL